MDQFFSKTCCDRCGDDLKDGRIMSMFNTQVICMVCKDKETKRQDYEKAVEADLRAIRDGNFNYGSCDEDTD